MKKLLLLLPLIALLTACQSKQDICARALIGDEGQTVLHSQKARISPIRSYEREDVNQNETWGKIRDFCRSTRTKCRSRYGLPSTAPGSLDLGQLLSVLPVGHTFIDDGERAQDCLDLGVGLHLLDRPSSTSRAANIGSASVMTPWLSSFEWMACLM